MSKATAGKAFSSRRELVIGLILLPFLLYAAAKVGRHYRDWLFGPAYTAHPYVVETFRCLFGFTCVLTCIVLLFAMSGAFRKEAPEERWVKIVLITFLIFDVLWFRELRHYTPSDVLGYGPKELILRTDVSVGLVLVLITIGISLYLLKRYHQVWFGAAELTIGVLSNVSLMKRIDLTRFPHLSLTFEQLIAIGLFAFLLNAGLTDVIQGLEKYRQSRPE